ncbi:MAG TPA: HXXEE domain-containing protein [Thermoanaerobaculia bacterium]
MRPALSRRVRDSWPLLLPSAYLLHLAEEWWGGEGFASWTARALGRQVSPSRFLLLNGIVWPLFAVLTVMALRKPALAWFPTTFSSIVLVNGVLHALGSLATGSYSPGVVTGVLLYLPLGAYGLVVGRRRLPPRTFALAVLAGILVHVLVAVIAFA